MYLFIYYYFFHLLLWFFYLEISKCFPLFHLSPLLTSNGKAGCKLKDIGFLNPLHGPLIIIMIIMIINFFSSLVINYFWIEICIVLSVPCIDKAVQRDWCKLAAFTLNQACVCTGVRGSCDSICTHFFFFFFFFFHFPLSPVIALMFTTACCCYTKISDGFRLWLKAVAVWSCATAPGTFSL